MSTNNQEKISIAWQDGMSFEADVAGHKIMLDADPDHGGQHKGPKPKPLLLVSLAGCTGMDVVSLLKKMRVDFKSLEIEVTGNLTDEHPKKFNKVKITYLLKGKKIDRNKVEKAVAMSQEKYCGVSASLKASMDLDYEIILDEG